MNPVIYQVNPPLASISGTILEVTAGGQLQLLRGATAPCLLDLRLTEAWERGVGYFLLQLGLEDLTAVLPEDLAYWRAWACRYLITLCRSLPVVDSNILSWDGPLIAPAGPELAERALQAPATMRGHKNVSARLLGELWCEINSALETELAMLGATPRAYLSSRNSLWKEIGRVHFNIAEHAADLEAPFAFVVTYTNGLTTQGGAQHQILSETVREYAEAEDSARLTALIAPIQAAANKCAWLKDLLDSGDICHPVRFSVGDTHQVLKDVQVLETAGIVLRAPATWKRAAFSALKVNAQVGKRLPSVLGAQSLLDFQVQVTLGDEPLSTDDLRELARGNENFKLLRGRWIEVDRAKLARVLEKFESLKKHEAHGVSIGQAMRLLAGLEEGPHIASAPDWTQTTAGPWLTQLLADLRSPVGLADVRVGPEFQGELYPYQNVGVRWLYLLHKLGLGACLADDMGIGKTVQVIALLLVLKAEAAAARQVCRPSILVAPAGLLTNWVKELKRFAPSLKFLVAHSSEMPGVDVSGLTEAQFARYDLILTAYGTALTCPWVAAHSWRLAILDEAQKIKNPGIRQTRAMKTIRAESRIALTGTPVENRSSDLWSIFDYLNPGLLGSARQFSAFLNLCEINADLSPIRALLAPYILRRLKSDPDIKRYLPKKIELSIYCKLTPEQAVQYQLGVNELALILASSDGMARRGAVLQAITRFKQVCNSSSHWLGDHNWQESNSGKLQELKRIAKRCARRGEKILVLTQYKAAVRPLVAFLNGVLGQPGVSMDGGTPIPKRRTIEDRFQKDPLIPFFIVSLGTGGVGLNLTAASTVVHFDRWWNPAVEDQGTDRAYRFGQKKTVRVYKFICRGTVEDRVDQLIESKKQLARDFLEGGSGVKITELTDQQLLALVTLDLPALQKAA